MTIYNTRVAVVALIEADSKEESIQKFRYALVKKGFFPLDDAGGDEKHADAFVSEDQDVRPDL
jgi:hypothetical protein